MDTAADDCALFPFQKNVPLTLHLTLQERIGLYHPQCLYLGIFKKTGINVSSGKYFGQAVPKDSAP